jgi:hypothetical protein
MMCFQLALWAAENVWQQYWVKEWHKRGNKAMVFFAEIQQEVHDSKLDG